MYTVLLVIWRVQPIADRLRHTLAWQRAQAPAFQIQEAVWLANEGAELLWVAEHSGPGTGS